MVQVTQVFSALAVLFLISSIPFPGEIRFAREASLVEKSAVVRGAGVGVVSLSNGNSRRRTEVENDSFPFVFSPEPFMSPALSENEFKGIGEHSQEEAEEELVGVSGEIPPEKLSTRAPEAQPIETVGAIFFGTREESDIESIGQPGHISMSTSVAVAPQTFFQAIPRVVVTSPSSLEGASGQEQPALSSEEAPFVSDFNLEKALNLRTREFKDRRQIKNWPCFVLQSLQRRDNKKMELQNGSSLCKSSVSCENLCFEEGSRELDVPEKRRGRKGRGERRRSDPCLSEMSFRVK